MVEAGFRVRLTGTVKAHAEYRGERQTQMSRCKIESVPGFDYSAILEQTGQATGAVSEHQRAAYGNW